MRQAARTTSALALLSLAALTVTACGGSSDSAADAPSADKPKATATRTEQPTPAERLAKLVITKADVDGYRVEKYDTKYTFAKSQNEVTVAKTACAPLAYAMNQLPLGKPQADLTRTVLTGKYGTASTYVTLATYASGEAKSAMAGLSKAVNSCGGGFTAKADGNTSPYDSVTSENAAPAGAESLAFKSTMTFRGMTHTLHTEAVRRDDIVAIYFSVNGFAIADGKPSDAKLPAAVVGAQNRKLG
ncbi:hypothetical protein AB0G54_10655 [Streptomyces yokosukanensis]|uniref:hypothetical protein n=1 Tax=Streptomyces yokosukanensis TaxID=67386 RepID=UPI00343C4880